MVNELVARARVDGKVQLNSDGTAWRPLVHVEDICRAFIAALRAPVAPGGRAVMAEGDAVELHRVAVADSFKHRLDLEPQVDGGVAHLASEVVSGQVVEFEERAVRVGDAVVRVDDDRCSGGLG